MNTQGVPIQPQEALVCGSRCLLFVRHWLILFLVLFGIYNFLPFAAPAAMRLATPIGSAPMTSIQLSVIRWRSALFLFGAQSMYNLDELPLRLTDKSADMLILRGFRGSDVFGWKVAWSDRMVYMYGSLWIISAVWVLAVTVHETRFVFDRCPSPCAYGGGR
jgi:hypothetical protein